ncbi:hypothetical protein JHD50_07460 [Sulfurimonas sp. MAG313]|nr:CRISPR-associated protein Csx20 [Sulfurimonas sp. MAG313]MDF1881139.1 hypothetical protein [Sulfurimonas sp. MAG313]
MRTMFVLISHAMTSSQCDDATFSLNVTNFKLLDTKRWSKIPADIQDISQYLEEIKHNILTQAKENDLLLVQGDFGATLMMVNFAHQHNLIPVYATTQRITQEKIQGDKVVTTRIFEHIMFRKYQKAS